MGNKKIVLCGEIYSSNFGDGIIVDSTKYIIDRINNKIEIEMMDFSCRSEYEKIRRNSVYKNTDIFRTLLKLLSKYKLFSIFSIFLWYIKRKRKYYYYYTEKMKGSSLLIFAGGNILTNVSLEYPLRLLLINKIARKHNVNIMFNSCGSEKSGSLIPKLLFKKALNSKNIISITVRDNIENLKYLSNNSQLKKVYKSNDPAILISEVYRLNKKASNIIGLGIISHLAYVNASSRIGNKYLLNENELTNYWAKIVHEIIKRGYRCKIISNGGYHDTAIAFKLKNKLNNNIEVFVPNTPYNLVEEISNYKGIIAHRLHSNIIAYSLKIPSIGLVWDDKLIDFGIKTDRKKYFINLKEFDIYSIVNLLEEAIKTGINETKYNYIKNNIIIDFQKKYTQNLIKTPS